MSVNPTLRVTMWPWLAWLVSRVPLALMMWGTLPNPWAVALTGDVELYRDWSVRLAEGALPAEDESWQYPPGAAVVMALPRLLPGPYPTVFVALLLAADLLVMVVLHALAARGGSVRGLWAWVGLSLLGPVVYGRYDLLPAATAVLALALAARPVVSGLLVGAGAMLKVWPVVLLVAFRPWRPLVGAVLGTLLGGLAVLGVVVFRWSGAFSFLESQQRRGLQIESLFATPFHLARALGWWDGRAVRQFGGRELAGALVPQVTDLAVVSTLVCGAVLAVWWWRSRERWTAATPVDAALCAVLLVTVTSRVLSPQFLVWLVAVAAVCLARRDTAQSLAAWLVVAAAPLTFLVFPLTWDGLRYGELVPALVLAARNAVLLAAAVASAVTLWRSTRRRPAVTEPTAPAVEPVTTD